MLGQYPPNLPPYFVISSYILLFAHLGNRWFCHLFPTNGRNLINKNQGKIPAICQITEIGELFLRADKEARTKAEKVKLSSSCFIHSRSNCLMGKILGRHCVSCYLRSPSEEMKYFSVFSCETVLSVHKTAEDFCPWKFLQKLEWPWDLLSFLCVLIHITCLCVIHFEAVVFNIMALRSQSWVMRKLTPSSHTAEIHATKRAENIYLGILEHKWDIVILSPWRCNCL